MLLLLLLVLQLRGCVVLLCFADAGLKHQKNWKCTILIQFLKYENVQTHNFKSCFVPVLHLSFK